MLTSNLKVLSLKDLINNKKNMSEEKEISTENLVGIKQVVSDLGDLKFDNEISGVEPIVQTEKAHQLKYVDNFLAAEAEYNLLLGLINDLSEYDEPIQIKAIEIAEKSKYEADYFEKNKDIDKDLMKPIQIARTIMSKIENYKTAVWKVNFYGGIVLRLREVKKPGIIGRIKAKYEYLMR